MVNYIAIIVAAVASMIIGMVWYSPNVFGKKWIKLQGFKASEVKKMHKKNCKQTMTVALIAALVTAYVLAYIMGLLGSASPAEGAKVGFWIWLGFVATSQLSAVLWEGKPKELWCLNTVHSLVCLAVMGAIIGAF